MPKDARRALVASGVCLALPSPRRPGTEPMRVARHGRGHDGAMSVVKTAARPVKFCLTRQAAVSRGDGQGNHGPTSRRAVRRHDRPAEGPTAAARVEVHIFPRGDAGTGEGHRPGISN